MLSFTVSGVPMPKGSMKAVSRPGGKTSLIPDNPKLKAWQHAVASMARWHMRERPPFDVAVTLQVVFFLPRPKSHLTAKGDLRASAPKMPTRKPDIDKLLRAICDALTMARVYTDDAVITDVAMGKRYASAARAACVDVRLYPTPPKPA